MTIVITGYNAICNVGNNIDDIYQKAINGDNSCFEVSENYIKNKKVRVGKINAQLPKIKEEEFNLRSNRLILKVLELLDDKITFKTK